MKKFLLPAVAALAMVTTACSDDDVMTAGRNDGTVVFEVSAPGLMASRAMGEGETANDLRVVIFDKDGNFLFTDSHRDLFASGKTQKVPVQLVNGEKYTVAFWVDTDFCYNIDNGVIDMNYGVSSNCDDNRDAFYAAREITVSSNNLNQSITLTRPFAQLNFGAGDFDRAVALGKDIQKASVTVEGGIYGALNLFSGDVQGEPLATVEFAKDAISSDPLEVGDKTYKWLGMAYVLVDKGGSNMTTELKLYDGNDIVCNIVPMRYTSIPGRRNFRTNIVGNLLTSTTEWTVTVNPMPEGDETVVTKADGTVICLVPALPEGASMAAFNAATDNNPGAVVPAGSRADGAVTYYKNTKAELKKAFAAAAGGEIYLAPNAVLPWTSHMINIPKEGITIHGNGATINGDESDFAVGQYEKFTEGSTVNINIYNLNQARVWGANAVDCTVNILLKNCSFKGKGIGGALYSGGIGMLRSSDTALAVINTTIEECHIEGVEVGYHSTHVGSLKVINSTFRNVGIPINIAKKLADRSMTVEVDGCAFINCGLEENVPKTAWDYAAPIRVVDNGGPANSIKLTIKDTAITDRIGSYDVLLMDYRAGKTWYPVKYTLTGCDNFEVRAE